MKYLSQFLAEYGSVARVHGICGVSNKSLNLFVISADTASRTHQDTALFLTDPHALAHVLVKDPDNFPEIDFTGSTE